VNVGGNVARRAGPVLLGIVVYVGITFAVYGLQRFAFPTGRGPDPLWYSSTEVVLKAVGAVGPGFVAAWLHAHPGFRVGAITGVLGVVAEFVIAIIGFGIPLSEFLGRMAAGLIAAGVATGLTNGVAGMAAEALRRRKRVAL